MVSCEACISNASVGKIIDLNPSNKIDIAFSKCIANASSYVLIWSNLDKDRFFESDTYTTLLAIESPRNKNEVVHINYYKFDPSHTLDLLFTCRVYGDKLLATGVENTWDSALYFFNKELRLVRKTVLSENHTWYSGFVIINNTLYLVGAYDVDIRRSYALTSTIFIEERSLEDYATLNRYVVVNTSYSLSSIGFLEYNNVSNEFFLTIIQMLPAMKSTLYIFNPRENTINKLIEVNGLLRFIGMDSNMSMYFLSILENKIYVFNGYGKLLKTIYTDIYYDWLARGVSPPKAPVEEKPSYQDGLILPYMGDSLVLSGIGTAYSNLNQKQYYEIYTNMLPYGKLLGGGSGKTLELKYLILDTLMVKTNNKIYTVFQGSKNDLNDYKIFIGEIDIVKYSEEECREGISYFNTEYNNYITISNTGKQGSNNVDVPLYYLIISLVVIGILILYIIHLRRKYNR